MNNVSVEYAAKIIGVSSATIRNWVKAGHIKPASFRPLLFLEDSVLELKSRIGSGSFNKLKIRANKVGSESNFFPEEYVENRSLISHIANIVSRVKDKDLEVEAIIFLASLRLLEQQGEVQKVKNGDPFSMETYKLWSRQSVKNAIFEWRSSFSLSQPISQYNHVYELLTPYGEEDFLGLLYQSIFREGSKSEQGSYYTPSKIVEESLSHVGTSIGTFLDPCCGSGKYLLIAAKKFAILPENIYGFDCDRIAANITRINLFMMFKDQEFKPNIFCMDSLSELATGDIFCETNALLGKIDVIATNPPWGAYKNLTGKVKSPGGVKSGETFSMFLEKSIQLLRKGGRLSFILPDSILKIKIHTDIREIILGETKISNIAILGRQFTGVFTPVIRLDLVKELASEDWLVSIEKDGGSSKVSQKRFKNNDDLVFDITTVPHDEELLNKIYSIDHVTLSKNAEWALGIVTGDNNKYVAKEQAEGFEPIFRGSDVFQYYFGEPKSFIQFNPAMFQQVAPEKFFRAVEKLIYRFISGKLVFSYDNEKRLTINSANILIPSIPDMSIKVVLAFLNSELFQYIFKKKFSTHKVLRGDLEKLPFPVLNMDLHTRIERLVEKVIITGEARNELENTIFSAFGLSAEDVLIIRRAVED